jgi:hypothetical protein
MALDINAQQRATVSFTVTDSEAQKSLTLSDAQNQANLYTYEASGSGAFTVSNVAGLTGLLESGLSTQIDLQSVNQQTIGSTQSISFTGIKHISIYNTSTTEGYDLSVQATGTNAFTNLFNGGSGNLLVKPYANFSYVDPYVGLEVSSSQRYLYLNDIGSGTTYKVIIFGLD